VSGEAGRVLCVRVNSVARFDTFGEMLRAIGHSKFLPGAAADATEGVVYYNKLSARDGVPYRQLEEQNGVVAIEVSRSELGPCAPTLSQPTSSTLRSLPSEHLEPSRRRRSALRSPSSVSHCETRE